jgi:hypothetical protein
VQGAGQIADVPAHEPETWEIYIDPADGEAFASLQKILQPRPHSFAFAKGIQRATTVWELTQRRQWMMCE